MEGESVLTAFQQVEDYLAAVRILSRQIQLEQHAVVSAQTFLNLELGRYQTGIDPYVDVVIAQTTLLTDQQNLANAQIEQMTARPSWLRHWLWIGSVAVGYAGAGDAETA